MPDRQVKDPADWTADDIAEMIPKVLPDAKAVDILLRMLAAQDPHRAQEMLDAIGLALFLSGPTVSP